MVKLCEIQGLLDVMRSFPTSSDEMLSNQAVPAKMALSMSASILETFEEQNLLQDLYNISIAILQRYPEVAKQENVQLAILKMQLALGDMNSAVDTAKNCVDARLRMFSTILERCSQTQNSEIALDVVQEIRYRGLRLTEKEIEYIFKCGLTMTELDKFLLDVSDEVEDAFSHSTFESLREVAGIDFDEGVGIDPFGDSICPVTGMRLRRIELTDEELSELISMTCSLSTEAGCSSEKDFQAIVSSQLQTLPDVVLDGANIAHVNQNFVDGYFRFDQIEDVVNNFENKNCLVVLHEKWLNPDKDLRLFVVNPDEPTRVKKRRKKPALLPLGNPVTNSIVDEDRPTQESQSEKPIVRPVPIELLEKWNMKKILFRVPHGQNDDWFWMHICCLAIRDGKKDLMIVTNDLMRDHYWRMQHPKAFSRFVKNHVCRFSIQFGEDGVNHFKYMYPPKHSVCMQRNRVVVDGEETIIWHIPYGMDVKWIIVRMKV